MHFFTQVFTDAKCTLSTHSWQQSFVAINLGLSSFLELPGQAESGVLRVNYTPGSRYLSKQMRVSSSGAENAGSLSLGHTVAEWFNQSGQQRWPTTEEKEWKWRGTSTGSSIFNSICPARLWNINSRVRLCSFSQLQSAGVCSQWQWAQCTP